MELNPNISLVTNIILPISLFMIMLGMGLSLVLADFKRVLQEPKAVLVGMLNQLVLLPIIGFGFVYIFGLSPIYAVGFMILTFCPGGPASNLITHVARGDIALAITLTAIASSVTAFSIPVLTQWALSYFGEGGQLVSLPMLLTIGQIFAITILPVSIGMFLKHRFPEFADSMDRPVRIGATLTFVLILITLIVIAWDIIVSEFSTFAFMCSLLNVTTLCLGYIVARLSKLDKKKAITIAIESGIQNTTLAFIMALTILDNYQYAVPAAIYGVLMFISGGLIMLFSRPLLNETSPYQQKN